MQNLVQKDPEMKDGNKNKSTAISEIKSLLIIILIALCFRTFVLEIFYVPTGSM